MSHNLFEGRTVFLQLGCFGLDIYSTRKTLPPGKSCSWNIYKINRGVLTPGPAWAQAQTIISGSQAASLVRQHVFSLFGEYMSCITSAGTAVNIDLCSETSI